AVVGDVELPPDEPLRIGQLPLEGLPPRLEPSELAGLLLPEAEGVGLGLLVDRRRLDAGALGEGPARRGLPSFLWQRLDGVGDLDRGRHGSCHLSSAWGWERLRPASL